MKVVNTALLPGNDDKFENSKDKSDKVSPHKEEKKSAFTKKVASDSDEDESYQKSERKS